MTFNTLDAFIFGARYKSSTWDIDVEDPISIIHTWLDELSLHFPPSFECNIVWKQAQ